MRECNFCKPSACGFGMDVWSVSWLKKMVADACSWGGDWARRFGERAARDGGRDGGEIGETHGQIGVVLQQVTHTDITWQQMVLTRVLCWCTRVCDRFYDRGGPRPLYHSLTPGPLAAGEGGSVIGAHRRRRVRRGSSSVWARCVDHAVAPALGLDQSLHVGLGRDQR